MANTDIENAFTKLAEALDRQTAALERSTPAPPLPGHTVTIGHDSDPELDKRLFCEPCRTGNPQWLGGDAQPARIAKVLAEQGELEATRVAGPLPGVQKLISYQDVDARAKLEAGIVGKQCLHCGNPIR